MLPTTRMQATSIGAPHYCTLKPCSRGHISKRFTKSGTCLECARENRARSYHANPEKSRTISNKWKAANKERQAAYMDTWRLENAERVKSYSENYRKENREKRLSQKSEWRRNNLPQVREYARARWANNLEHKLSEKIRGFVWRVSKGKTSESSRARIGYCPEKLKQRLECQFSKGMTWENYGEWEIDHKIPVSKFISRGETRVNIINALSNLQPLWREQNRSKGNRYAS